MGIWESALILLGIGIVSERFGAGVGLGQLGVGIRELAGAPLGGLGMGLGEFGTGLRTFAESLGDVGRGFGELFKHIPEFGEKGFPPRQPPAITIPPVTPPMITVSGGDRTTNLAGGGGNVPVPLIAPLPGPPYPSPGPFPTPLVYEPDPTVPTGTGGTMSPYIPPYRPHAPRML